METKVTRLGNEPIIVAAFSGALTKEKARSAIMQVAELAEGLDAPIFRIIDTRATTSSFSEVMMIMVETAKKNAAGSAADSRFHSIVVGTDHMIKLLTDGLKQKQYGQINVPLFANMEEALAYAREQIAHA